MKGKEESGLHYPHNPNFWFYLEKNYLKISKIELENYLNTQLQILGHHTNTSIRQMQRLDEHTNSIIWLYSND